MSELRGPRGPYETEAEMLADLEPFGGTATDAETGRARLLMLRDALAAAHVDAGSFDMLVLARFGHWEPESAMVVAGLLERAYAAGQQHTE